MKRFLTIFTCLIAVAWAEPDWHTFTSADGGKKFAGKLVSFRQQGELVTVKRKDTNRDMSFKISILSEEDQKYILEQAPALTAAGAIRVSFDKNLVRLDDDKARKYTGCYQISVENLSSESIQDVEVEYLVIYQKGSLAKGSTIVVDQGNKVISDLLPNLSDYVETSSITLQSASSRDKEACSGSS